MEKEYENDVRVRIPSMKKFDIAYNYTPMVTVEESINKCIEHYMEKQHGIH